MKLNPKFVLAGISASVLGMLSSAVLAAPIVYANNAGSPRLDIIDAATGIVTDS